MDDPLSALDAHVGRFIFEKTFTQYLKGKTIILVTHAINFVKFFDYIYLFDKGKIALQGKFEDINQHEFFIDLLTEIQKKKEKEGSQKSLPDNEEID